ncbi:putative myb-like dna-binding domain-containing protein [Phaeoacremonium minimum UCRPA7]|uniref:Putative myb-like dna-binding domain-containing protein n=1 Tax=Phaeoacremonium minimum (strain UCR-PA7) TaxID=1286976 RepID=R8BFP9_PHAM7|nr:putative myb-like dna-binding domain-containing protein [Phaeoacremonium minimum UCRPA7]EON98136.1 putative myb-like dna-binding domain-containing protein [Phaeoacremonium minimum UCRPA7]
MNENAEAAPKKRTRKRKADAENNEEAGEQPEPKKSRRKRSVTPEDAEEQLVDPSQMTMGDLTKDLRIGKKFSRHDELRQRIRDKRSRARLIKLGRIPAEDQSQNGGSNAGTPAPGANGDNSATPTPSDLKSSQPGDGDGVQYRMVDGQIVVDTRSLLVDRQARAAAQNGNIEEIEENDFTRPTTSATYMKPHKVGPNHWTDDETERFYEFLRKFGTDFNIIAAMFGGKKTRREVKLKFNREERYCPRRINACIVGKKEWHMDMEEIKNHTGKEYEDSKDIEAELARLAAAHEAEEKRAEEEIAEAARQKREALFGNRNSHRAGGTGSVNKGKEADKENGTATGEEDPEVDIQDMAQQQTGKAKPKGRGRGKRGYGKAAQAMASGFGS